MSIKLDWEISDAPNEPSTGSRPAPPEPPVEQAPRPKRRAGWLARWTWPIVLGVFGLAVGIFAWSQLQAGWKRITADLVSLVRLEEQLSYDGDWERVLGLQAPGNPEWLAARAEQLRDSRPAPLPLPFIQFASRPIQLKSFTALATDHVRVDVSRQYTTTQGQTLTYALPQFYERNAEGVWLRAGLPNSFWGSLQAWESTHLRIRYYEPDEALVRDLAPQIEARLAETCQVWEEVCAALPPAHLYLSPDLRSLSYDPLFNLEVSIVLDGKRVRASAAEDALADAAPDFFVSLPSPHLSGIPDNAASASFLADYMAVRLIASLARRTFGNPPVYIAQALAALDLLHADPGFVPSGQATLAVASPLTPSPTPSAQPTQAETSYVVKAGDTLWQIALTHGVSLDVLIQRNSLSNPDSLQVGQVILIPHPLSEDN